MRFLDGAFAQQKTRLASPLGEAGASEIRECARPF
jgi:hypothetical protein